MKKLLYLLILTIIAPFSLWGQEYGIRKELNVPRIGDDFNKEEFQFPSGVQSASKEKRQKDLWDFSKTRNVEKEKAYTYIMEDGEIVKVVEIRETPWITYLEGEGNKFTEYTHTARNHYSFSGDSLFDYGRENSGTRIYYHKPGLIIHYPFDYGDRCTSNFYGRGLHWQRMESENTGTITSHADGFGTLILPSGDTLTSVVRLHIHKEEFVRYAPASLNPDISKELIQKMRKTAPDSKAMLNDNFELNVTDTHQWYQYGFRYPVFETVSSYTKVKDDSISHEPISYVFYPSDQRKLPGDKANETIGRQQAPSSSSALSAIIELRLNCYPSPVVDRLNVEVHYEPGQSTLLSLYSSSGALLHKASPDRMANGYFKTVIEMASYPKGTYLVQVQSGGQQVSQKINK